MLKISENVFFEILQDTDIPNENTVRMWNIPFESPTLDKF
jgi:hypothetical protein